MPVSKIITVTTWNELREALDFRKDKHTDRFRSNFVFRGVAVENYNLEPSIQRIGRLASEVESHLIRSFKKYAPLNTLLDNYDNIWNWLALAQHHGLPTRLLDWTFSADIALHFLTESRDRFETDGAIWMVDCVKLHDYLPGVLKRHLDDENVSTFSSDDLDKVIGSSLNDIHKLKDNAMVFFEPPSISDRIVSQYGLFSFMLDVDSSNYEWLKQHPSLWRKIIIPKELKWEIRDRLDQANITERVIYPGLDGLSKWLARWYSNKNMH